jgi:SAM-dependent methyltransferase
MNRAWLVLVVLGCAGPFAAADDWPQWRGPARTNVSAETGLRPTWPKDGPPVAWRGNYDRLHCYDVRLPPRRQRQPDAVFVPTPDDVVTAMLDLAGVKSADLVYDLGSGDGRIVIAAAKRGCKAIGIEISNDLVKRSREAVSAAGVGARATIVSGDLFEADFANATVVVLYILPGMSQRLLPRFARLQPGARLVSHAFPIPDIVPTRVVQVRSQEDDVERPVYLYTIPLKKKASSNE